ncbi:MAG: TonB C-terminal domain-containing protein [Candidatus Eisenbacteria bacterium]|nr:TonB C-terminal domain-containing protein [Candidatus Eisenbacteria bacterium]
MRSAVIGSAAVHVLLTAALFLVRSGKTVLVPGPDVVQVSLVDASLAALPAPAPAPRAPETVQPAEEEGVRLDKKKREKAKPQPEAAAAKQPPAPVPTRDTPKSDAPRVVLPYASVGGGMAGQVAVDESNFEFAYYLQRVRTMIASNWTAPSGVGAGTRVEVYFRISRDGALSSPRVETSSGNSYFDQSAVRAVLVTGHLPPLPMGWNGSDLGVHFGFEYTGP